MAMPEIIILHADKRPILTGTLTHKSIQKHIEKVEAWANNYNFQDSKLKREFILSFTHEIADQWFSANKEDVQNHGVTWDEFKNKFLEQCPTEKVDKDLKLTELFRYHQLATESPRTFALRIRYSFGNTWNKYHEDTLIEAIIEQLLIPVRRFIKFKDIPKTYPELVTILNDYEENGM